MTDTALSVRDQLIAIIQAAWVHDLRATVYTTNGGDVDRVIATSLVDDTNVNALSYNGYINKEGNEDGSHTRGESATIENWRLSFRVDRSAGQDADEGKAKLHLLRKYLRDNPKKRWIREDGIAYEITIGDGEVIPTNDPSYDRFDIPITLS